MTFLRESWSDFEGLNYLKGNGTKLISFGLNKL